MLRERFREYFSFTKKERIGVFTLIALIVIVFLLPYFFSSAKNKQNQQEFEQFRNEMAQLKVQQPDPNRSAPHDEKKEGEENGSDYEPVHRKDEKIKAELFYFDPNTVPAEDWKRLGLRDKTIRTIQNYLSKGGKFRKAEDLKKVYGLHENEYQQLLPFVKIKDSYSYHHSEKTEINTAYNSAAGKQKIVQPIDVNEADTSDFIALPGIGSKLANRIISFREKLGGFYSVEQIGDTYNLPDSTFQKIKPFLRTGNKAVEKININTADAATLKMHPYIKWNVANAIVQYRAQHGNYKSIQDLKQIAVITPEVFEKIYHYLTADTYN